jgi:hypothetical protein
LIFFFFEDWGSLVDTFSQKVLAASIFAASCPCSCHFIYGLYVRSAFTLGTFFQLYQLLTEWPTTFFMIEVNALLYLWRQNEAATWMRVGENARQHGVCPQLCHSVGSERQLPPRYSSSPPTLSHLIFAHIPPREVLLTRTK